MSTTISPDEINKFQKDSAHWWDESGPFAPLHTLNPVRLKFVRTTLETFGKDRAKTGTPLKGTRHLDIGCGGGLVAEPLARLGAAVTGLDADVQAIEVARTHAQEMGLSLDYHVATIEDFRKENKTPQFDTITAFEIIEHVADPAFFLAETAAMLKPGGILFVSTLNRTAWSFMLGIIAAEYVLGWVPKGTHNWRQFVPPSTLARILHALGLTPVAAQGITYHPLRREFALDPHDLRVNYMMAFVKKQKRR